MTFQSIVYVLCLLTSTAVAVLLYRGFVKSRARLLFWSAVCFVFLALNNLFVVADILVFPDFSLYWFRQIAAFAAIAVLLYAFIWELE
jgi:hypothetical protein